MNGQLQLIAGERRLRAAQEVGLTKVPIRIVDFNDQQTLEAALVENIQRSDLNPIEKALGFKEHLDRFGFSHEQLAKRLGLARSSITNLVNLLELAPEVQDGIRLGQISEAHGKILKGVKDRTKQVGLFKQIVAMGLSVKATETLLREQSGKTPASEGASGGGSSGDPTARATASTRRLTSAVSKKSSGRGSACRSRFACKARTPARSSSTSRPTTTSNGCSRCSGGDRRSPGISDAESSRSLIGRRLFLSAGKTTRRSLIPGLESPR